MISPSISPKCFARTLERSILHLFRYGYAAAAHWEKVHGTKASDQVGQPISIETAREDLPRVPMSATTSPQSATPAEGCRISRIFSTSTGSLADCCHLIGWKRTKGCV
jgi:hypothetical protein